MHRKLHLCKGPTFIVALPSLQQFSGLHPCELPILRQRNFLQEPQLRQQRRILRPHASSRRQWRICRYFRGGIWNKCNLRRNIPRPSAIPDSYLGRKRSRARKKKHDWSLRIRSPSRIRNLGGKERPLWNRDCTGGDYAKRRHYKC